MRVRFRGDEYELRVHHCPRFADGPYLGVDISPMRDVVQFEGGTPSPPGMPLPEIDIRTTGPVNLLLIRDDFARVEPMEMASIRRMPNVCSRGGWYLLPVSEWMYCSELDDVLGKPPPSRVIDFPAAPREGRADASAPEHLSAHRAQFQPKDAGDDWTR